MKSALYLSEDERLAALEDLDFLDTPHEERFDEIVDLAAAVCQTPMAALSLIDKDRQWFKAETSLGPHETPCDLSICSHVNLNDDLTVIDDTLLAARSDANPLRKDDPNIRFFAGAVLRGPDSQPLGALCVMDRTPRTIDETQRKALQALANQAASQLLLRQQLEEAKLARAELNHRIKNSLSLIMSLLGMQASRSANGIVRNALSSARSRVMAVAKLHDQLHETGGFDGVELRPFLERLATALRHQAPPEIAIRIDGEAMNVPAAVAVNIGIVVNELVTNAIKHAFRLSRSGTIVVRVEADANTIRVEVEDDGDGLPDNFDMQNRSGLGLRVALALARQSGEALSCSSGDGRTVFRFSFALADSPKA